MNELPRPLLTKTPSNAAEAIAFLLTHKDWVLSDFWNSLFRKDVFKFEGTNILLRLNNLQLH